MRNVDSIRELKSENDSVELSVELIENSLCYAT